MTTDVWFWRLSMTAYKIWVIIGRKGWKSSVILLLNPLQSIKHWTSLCCALYSLRVLDWAPHKASCPIFLHWPAGSSPPQAGSCSQWAETSGWCEENCEASKSTRAQCNPPEPKTSLPREKVRLQPKLASLCWSGQFGPLPEILTPPDSYQTKAVIKACSSMETRSEPHMRQKRGSSPAGTVARLQSEIRQWMCFSREEESITAHPCLPCPCGAAATIRQTAAPSARHSHKRERALIERAQDMRRHGSAHRRPAEEF